MSGYIDGPIRTFVADEALEQYRNVKMDADGKVTYADATDDYDGTTTREAFAAGDSVPVRLRSAPGTAFMTAVGAISAGAYVCAAADGKINDLGSKPIGKALEAASGDGAVIEVLPIDLPETWMPTGAPQALSGAGAVNVTSFRTNWTTGSAQAGTLADGTRVGQLKHIQLIVDGGDGTLTPANFGDGTTITFADAGDFALLRWDGAEWWVVALGNDADGATAPVVA